MFLLGVYAMLAARNLIRKIIGMGIMQSAVMLFFITLSYKWGAKVPIVPHGGDHEAVDPALYANPLPHALMLTAIVVGVSLLGVALVLSVSIYRELRTLEEDEILKKLEDPVS